MARRAAPPISYQPSQPTNQKTNKPTSQSTNQPTIDLSVGIACRICGSRRLRITHTYRVIDAVLRRRRCLDCGFRFRTRERELHCMEGGR
jgi:hypothetical protein